MSYEHIYVIGLNDHVWRLHLEEGFYHVTVLHFRINTEQIQSILSLCMSTS